MLEIDIELGPAIGLTSAIVFQDGEFDGRSTAVGLEKNIYPTSHSVHCITGAELGTEPYV